MLEMYFLPQWKRNPSPLQTMIWTLFREIVAVLKTSRTTLQLQSVGNKQSCWVLKQAYIS